MKIAILNYNAGNLSSIQNALNALGADCKVIRNADEVARFDKLILPGVGAFGDAIAHLNQSGMSEAIKDFAKRGKYLLGICLGMQLLMDKSYEFGEFAGLGLIKGEVVKFKCESLKIPQIGWNQIHILRESPLIRGVQNQSYLYFVHSFYVKNAESADIVASCDYGINFSAILQKDNIFGIQPHPEKSADTGLKILENFINLK
ncbi:imidazole glycerol phosphate synthase subunit HisH [Helicobacter sp. 23-1045]